MLYKDGESETESVFSKHTIGIKWSEIYIREAVKRRLFLILSKYKI